MRLKSHVQYSNSKSKIVKAIEKHIPPNCQVIISPFMGGGSFEYYIIEKRPNLKLFGYDNNKYVMNYHKCMISNPKKLHKTLTTKYNEPVSKDVYIEMKNNLLSDCENIDPFEKAGMYYSVSRNTYSGTSFSYNRNPRMSNIDVIKDYKFNSKNSKYGRIYVKVKDWTSVLKRPKIKDNDDVFIFLDPPDYDSKQMDFDHCSLYKSLKDIKTKWMLLYTYNIGVCDMYKTFNIRSLSGGGGDVKEMKKGDQMIITNF